MVEHERVNLKLLNQQIKKLKEAVKSNNGTTLRIGNKNFNKADLLHKLFLTQTQVNKLRGKVEKNMSTDIKLNKAQIHKLIKSGSALISILARFFPKLIKPALSLGKNTLAPLGLSVAMSVTDAAIQQNMYRSGTKTVEFSNKDLDDMTKIVKALEDSDVLMKGVTKTLKNDIKNGGALSLIPMLLDTLGASLLTGGGMLRAGNQGQGMFRAGKGILKKSLIPFYPLTHFEMNHDLIVYFQEIIYPI